jgi:ABC-type nitrate/sulfonate/bicarbonate transport system substrate-binding protein
MTAKNPKAALVAALTLAASWAASMASPTPAVSQEMLRAGKAVPESIAFIPLDVGVKSGIFKKHGLNVEITAFGGGARLQQAMAADSIDVGLGSGPEMAYIEKGSPVKAVAMVVGPPIYLVLLVRPDSPINAVADLKGRRINVSSVRSLTGWLVGELSRQQGWGPRGIELVNFSPSRTAIAVMKTGQIDGMMTDMTFALRAEQNREGKIFVRFGDLVKDFHTHVVFATDRLIEKRPETIRKFLLGWFETIAFMRANKEATVKVAMEVLNLEESIASPAYDSLMSMFSDDGRFDSKALAALSRSYVELDLLPSEPKDMRKLYTEEFLPR